MTPITRRQFLADTVRAALAATLMGPAAALADPGGRPTLMPEYDGTLDEMLVVFDQVRARHLLREIVEIVRHAPADARLHVLVSRALEDEAKARLGAHDIRVTTFIPSDAERVSGDWGRDVLQIAQGADGVRTIHVPWNKVASARGELSRGARQLAALAREDLHVQQLPAAFEGGNLMADVTADGRRVLYAGSTIAVETQALYQRWYGSAIGSNDVARILADALGADEVVWIGGRDATGRLQRQPHLLFHVDMGMTLVARGVAVVARIDAEGGWPASHRDIIARELEKTREALARREQIGLPVDSLVSFPDAGDEAEYVDRRVQEEAAMLDEAAVTLEATADLLSERGYQVHRVNTEPQRARRFQSYTNVIPCRDRLIVPIYPSVDRVHGWVVPGDNGRDRVDVDPGLEDSEFALEGGNLTALELYRQLHHDVRVVRDYFFMASGNVHCVIGRLS